MPLRLDSATGEICVISIDVAKAHAKTLRVLRLWTIDLLQIPYFFEDSRVPRNSLQVENPLLYAQANCHCTQPNPSRVSNYRSNIASETKRLPPTRPPLSLAKWVLLPSEPSTKIDFPGAWPLDMGACLIEQSDAWGTLPSRGIILDTPFRNLREAYMQFSIDVLSHVTFLVRLKPTCPEKRFQILG